MSLRCAYRSMSFEPISFASGAAIVDIVAHVRSAESLMCRGGTHLNLWFEAKDGTAQAEAASRC